MTFSWKELVCHGLLKKVGDPSLVKDLLKIVMKERRDLLEEEAREFRSWFVYPVVGVYFHNKYDHPGIIHEFKRIAGYCKVARPPAKLEEERWLTAIRHKNVNKEFISSWKERQPVRRRRIILIALVAGERGWEPAEDGLTDLLSDDGGHGMRWVVSSAKCQWYQGIHEGRYYLFWHKDSFRAAACDTIRDGPNGAPEYVRHRLRGDILKASIDINVIEGRKRENRWTWPGRWGWWTSCWKWLLDEGVKERKHIDDMFC